MLALFLFSTLSLARQDENLLEENIVDSLVPFQFVNWTNLSSVIINGSITSFPESVFDGCTSLFQIQLNETVIMWSGVLSIDSEVQSIGPRAFANTPLSAVRLISVQVNETSFVECFNLRRITIFSSDLISFYGMSKLQYVTINNLSVVDNYVSNVSSIFSEIPIRCFSKTPIVEITISSPNLTIKESAFSNCPNLKRLNLPYLNSLDYPIFDNCPLLESITIDGKTVFDDGVLDFSLVPINSISTLAISNIPKMDTFIIYSNLHLASNSISSCQNLRIIEFDSIINTTIDTYFIQNVTNLRYLLYKNGINCSSIPFDFAQLFSYSNSRLIHIQTSWCNIDNQYQYSDSTRRVITKVTTNETSVLIPDYVTNINNYAFKGTLVESVILDDFNDFFSAQEKAFADSNIRSILYRNYTGSQYLIGFQNVLTLETVGISGNVHISSYCFAGSLNFQNLRINERDVAIDGELNLTGFEDGGIAPFAFYNTSFYSVFVPINFTIFPTLFMGMFNLSKVTFANSFKQFPHSLFDGCVSLQTIIYQERIFYEDGNLSVLGFDFESFKNTSFANTPLTQVYLPNTVKDVGPTAFINCSQLTTIIIENNVPLLAFTGLSSISDYSVSGIKIIDNGVVNLSTVSQYWLNDYAFTGSSITEIYIPERFKKFNNHAFNNCPKLTKIVIESNVSEISYPLFSNATSLKYISIGNNSVFNHGVFDLSGTGISSIPSYFIYNLNELSIFAISGNLDLPSRSVVNSPNLEILNIKSLSSANIHSDFLVNAPEFYSIIYTGNTTCEFCNGKFPFNDVFKSSNSIVFRDQNSWCYEEPDFIYQDQARQILIGVKTQNLSVIIPKHVRKIENDSFLGANATNLSFESGSHLHSLHPYAFRGSNLVSIKLPLLNVLSGFQFASSLEELEIENISSISPYCFNQSPLLSSIKIGDNYFVSNYALNFSSFEYISLHERALAGSSFISAFVPDSVSNLTDYMFYGMENLLSIILQKEFPIIPSYFVANSLALNFILYSDQIVLENGSLDLSGFSFDEIQYHAFENTSITSAVVPGSVNFLAPCVFRYCASLKTLDINIAGFLPYFTGMKSISDCVINGSYIISNYVVDLTPLSPSSLRDELFLETPITNATIPDSIDLINVNVFANCSQLQSIIIVNNLKSIKYPFFSNCSSLEYISIGGNDAFNNATFDFSKTKIRELIPGLIENIPLFQSFVIYDTLFLHSAAIVHCSNFEFILIQTIHVVDLLKFAFIDCPNIRCFDYIGNTTFDQMNSLIPYENFSSLFELSGSNISGWTAFCHPPPPTPSPVPTQSPTPSISSLPTQSLTFEPTTLSYLSQTPFPTTSESFTPTSSLVLTPSLSPSGIYSISEVFSIISETTELSSSSISSSSETIELSSSSISSSSSETIELSSSSISSSSSETIESSSTSSETIELSSSTISSSETIESSTSSETIELSSSTISSSETIESSTTSSETIESLSISSSETIVSSSISSSETIESSSIPSETNGSLSSSTISLSETIESSTIPSETIEPSISSSFPSSENSSTATEQNNNESTTFTKTVIVLLSVAGAFLIIGIIIVIICTFKKPSSQRPYSLIPDE